jgi:hypothetical protein
MITVRTLSKDDWARYALLIVYAWDMCDLNQDPASNELDPRILADGWRAVGIISGKDLVSSVGRIMSLRRPPVAGKEYLPRMRASGNPWFVPGLISGGTGTSQ